MIFTKSDSESSEDEVTLKKRILEEKVNNNVDNMGESALKRHCNCENLKVIALERSGRADDLGQQKQNKLV